jgi:hypothetical protein
LELVGLPRREHGRWKERPLFLEISNLGSPMEFRRTARDEVVALFEDKWVWKSLL